MKIRVLIFLSFLFPGCFLTPIQSEPALDTSLQAVCFAPGCVVQNACKLFYGAQKSIYLAMYHLDHPQILHCLEQNTSRSLDIQVVSDLSHADPAVFSKLMHKGVKFFPGNENGLMHNKYLIIDEQKVMTGSANYSLSLESSHNLTLIFDSEVLASYYLKDFNAYQTYHFGPAKSLPSTTLSPNLQYEALPLPFFTPYQGQYSDFYTGAPFSALDTYPVPVYEDLLEWNDRQELSANGISERSIDLDHDLKTDLYLKDVKTTNTLLPPSKVIYRLGPLNSDLSPAYHSALNALLFFALQARSSLTLAAYSLTEPTLLRFLSRLARAKKIQITILMDYKQAKTMQKESLSRLQELQQNCGCVFLYQNPGMTLHHKFMYLDGQRLLTGSLNFSESAFTRNDENFLILNNIGSFRSFLEKEITLLRSHALPLSLEMN